MKKTLLPLVLFLLIMVSSYITNAQPQFNDDVDEVPIDGGLSLLIAAGAGYGIKKVKQAHKKQRIDTKVQ